MHNTFCRMVYNPLLKRLLVRRRHCFTGNKNWFLGSVKNTYTFQLIIFKKNYFYYLVDLLNNNLRMV